MAGPSKPCRPESLSAPPKRVERRLSILFLLSSDETVFTGHTLSLARCWEAETETRLPSHTILLQQIIEIGIGSMLHTAPQVPHVLLVGRKYARLVVTRSGAWPTTARACADQIAGRPPYLVSRLRREATRLPSSSRAR